MPMVFKLTFGQQTPPQTQIQYFSTSGVQTQAHTRGRRGGKSSSPAVRDKERGLSWPDTGSTPPPGAGTSENWVPNGQSTGPGQGCLRGHLRLLPEPPPGQMRSHPPRRPSCCWQGRRWPCFALWIFTCHRRLTLIPPKSPHTVLGKHSGAKQGEVNSSRIRAAQGFAAAAHPSVSEVQIPAQDPRRSGPQSPNDRRRSAHRAGAPGRGQVHEGCGGG